MQSVKKQTQIMHIYIYIYIICMSGAVAAVQILARLSPKSFVVLSFFLSPSHSPLCRPVCVDCWNMSSASAWCHSGHTWSNRNERMWNPWVAPRDPPDRRSRCTAGRWTRRNLDDTLWCERDRRWWCCPLLWQLVAACCRCYCCCFYWFPVIEAPFSLFFLISLAIYILCRFCGAARLSGSSTTTSSRDTFGCAHTAAHTHAMLIYWPTKLCAMFRLTEAAQKKQKQKWI